MAHNASSNLMPVLFVGHGSPMNLVEENRYTKAWSRLGQEIPRPRAILGVSAHWLTRKTEIETSESPKQIFDFDGFPDALYEVKYTPPGAPQLARELISHIPGAVGTEAWGIDHGTWSILHHMYPDQSIPTFQMSLNVGLKPLEHLNVATSLRFLRSKGVLILCSGNLVHSLRDLNWESASTPHSWAVDFENEVIEILQNEALVNEEKIIRIFSHPHLRLSHPSVDHLLPLIYSLGAANEKFVPFVEVRGIQNASISMATLRF